MQLPVEVRFLFKKKKKRKIHDTGSQLCWMDDIGLPDQDSKIRIGVCITCIYPLPLLAKLKKN